jgi:hypothetical protein
MVELFLELEEAILRIRYIRYSLRISYRIISILATIFSIF